MGLKQPTLTVEELAAEVTRLKQVMLRSSHAGASTSQHSGSSSKLPQLSDLEAQTGQVIKSQSGDIFKGDTLGIMRHGTGTFTSSAGDIYTGQWQYDRRHGRGQATFSRTPAAAETLGQSLPVRYDGEWEDDKTQGQGSCTYQDGAIYTGHWHQDQRCGWGRHTFSNSDWYEGEWAADTMQGQGLLKMADGSWLKGAWQAGQLQTGHWSSADGKSEYEGQFKGMAWHGFGTLHETGVKKYMACTGQPDTRNSLTAGTAYQSQDHCPAACTLGSLPYEGGSCSCAEGQWIDGLEHGYGQCVSAGGVTYDGQWEHGNRQGQGKACRGDGYLYIGSWAGNLPHGKGKCRSTDGSKYEGAWKAGKRHGQGLSILGNGDHYKGRWDADAQHGQGICAYANGNQYQGTWKGGKRHGRGVCHFADGTVFRGDWEEDAWLQSAAEPSLCTAAGPGLSHAVAGQEALFVIQAFDEVSNKRLSGGDIFVVKLVGPAGVETTADVADQDDGTYSVTYSCNTAGSHDVHITAGDGERVADSPYTLQVAAARPVPRRSTVNGAGRRLATVGQEAGFTIEGRDQYGNRCDGNLGSALQVSIELSCKPFSCRVLSVAQDDGCLQCTYRPEQAGFYRLEVTSQGGHLSGSPYSVQVSEAPQVTETVSQAAHRGSRMQLQQQVNAMDSICQPLVDKLQLWAGVAAAEYAADGDMQGWEAEEGKAGSSEDSYIKANPHTPVVEDLQDLWLVSKLQNERKAQHMHQE